MTLFSAQKRFPTLKTINNKSNQKRHEKKQPMKSPISTKFCEEKGKNAAKDVNITLNSYREVHFIKDPVFSRRFPRSLRFPATTTRESHNFSMVVRVMAILIENLSRDHTVTRRDIYYQDVELFQNQTNVDSIISTLCSSLGFKDFEMNAIAAQKGLFNGDVELRFPGNVSQSYSRLNGPQLIPRIYDVVEIKVSSSTQYCLVVEKESVFSTLLQDQSPNRLLITGKGFPDQLTKSFVSKLSQSNPHLIVVGFADLDPYGINIMKMYKTGGNTPSLKTPNLVISRCSIMDFINTSSCLDLPQRDFTICSRLLTSPKEQQFVLDKSNRNIKIELQRMMFLGKKAELDGIKTTKLGHSSQNIDLIQYINKIVNPLLQ